jgi:FixJ family two-component response regulator
VLIHYEVTKVLQAIDQISEGCKTVLNLYLFEGYDHKEIAQILNISESTSKAQYSKAKAKVRKNISGENLIVMKDELKIFADQQREHFDRLSDRCGCHVGRY